MVLESAPPMDPHNAFHMAITDAPEEFFYELGDDHPDTLARVACALAMTVRAMVTYQSFGRKDPEAAQAKYRASLEQAARGILDDL